MTNPVKVLAFLDVAGSWGPYTSASDGRLLADPRHLATFLFAKTLRNSGHRPASLWCSPKARIDAKLITGSAIFGIGWGLSGFARDLRLVSI